MAILFFLFLFPLLVSLACVAEIISLRSPSLSLSNPQFHPDLDLLDIVLVASVDGKFHALNRSSGHILWSMSSSPSSTSISTPSTLAPLVRTSHIDHDPDLTDDTTRQELYVIEPQSGDIYVMATPTSPLQRFPFSVPELVDLSPFSFSGDEDRRVFVGRKETSLLLMELETGKVKATLNSECPWDPFEDLHNDEGVDLDELEGSKPQMSTPTEVFIGRTDYHISIHTRPLDPNLPRPPVQNLSFSTYGPNNQDSHIQATYRRTKDDAYIQSLPNGEIISFKARSRDDKGDTSNPHLLWGQPFPNPIVAIFDVLCKPDPNPQPHHAPHNHTLVLLQPRPNLQDVLPTLTPDAPLPNLKSAYVGIVPETGSLFAMSPTRFPLVAFGGADKFGSGSSWGRGRGRFIGAEEHADSSGGGSGRTDVDWDGDVDSITKARKHREKIQMQRGGRCTSESLYLDRKCLIGVRPLEDGDGHESRMRRLLDGPAGRLPLTSPMDSGPGAPTFQSGPLPAASGDGEANWSRSGRSTIDGVDGVGVGWGEGVGMLGWWEGVVVTVLLGVVSLWFAFRRLRGAVERKRLVLSLGEENGAGGEDRVEEVNGNGVVLSPQSNPGIDAITPVQTLIPKSPQPNGHHTNADGTPTSTPFLPIQADDGEGDSDPEAEAEATPGKRKARRGKRGKKKKEKVGNNNLVLGLLNPGEEGVGEGVSGNGSGEGTPISSLVINSPRPQVPATPSLTVSDTILGFGSHGTVVFQGSLQGRAVAVKRLLQDFVTLAAREVSILQESDDHPNVIRYYYQESQHNFLYIALELCPCSLADIVETPDREQWRHIAVVFEPKRALRQIASGLRHLHALKLVHRDIKPQNILVSGGNGDGRESGSGGRGGYRMLISDFGLCKKLDVDQTSFLPTAQGAMAAGTVGWRAPEILRGEVKLDEISVHDEHSMSSRGSSSTVNGNGNGRGTPTQVRPTRLTKSVDIFALGCLFYYTLTNGGHPFGDRFEREVNILKNAKSLEGLERFGEEGSEAVDLIEQMLDPEAGERPDTTTCLLHPFFWNPGRRLNFLQDVSDRFEIMCRDPKDPYLLILEKGAQGIVGNDWHAKLDKVFIENLGKFRKYDGRSVQDLLRALRNKKHHYQDMPENLKRHLGPMPEGFLAYFTKRFPRLFLHVHCVIRDTSLRTESMFRSYFELPE